MRPETARSNRRRPTPCDGLPAASGPAAPFGPGFADEITVEIDRGAVPPVVVVTGRLGREGGALLAAMLAHVQRQSGPRVVLDLRQVSYADRLGLAPVLDATTVIRDASPVVDRELCALVGEPAPAARRLRALRHRRPAVVAS